MHNFYITFSAPHIHTYQGKLLDYERVALMRAVDLEHARVGASKLFGNQYCFVLDHEPHPLFYPKGIIEL